MRTRQPRSASRRPRPGVALAIVGAGLALGNAANARGEIELSAGPVLELPLSGFGCSGPGYGGELGAREELGAIVVGARVGALTFGAPGACHTTFGQSRENDGIFEGGSWGMILEGLVAARPLRQGNLTLLVTGALGARRMSYRFDPALPPAAIRWLPQVQVSSRLGYALGRQSAIGGDLGLTGLYDFDRGPSSTLGPPISRFGAAIDLVVFGAVAF
jgi:hypothetical protein